MAQGVCREGGGYLKNLFEKIVVISTSAAGNSFGYCFMVVFYAYSVADSNDDPRVPVRRSYAHGSCPVCKVRYSAVLVFAQPISLSLHTE